MRRMLTRLFPLALLVIAVGIWSVAASADSLSDGNRITTTNGSGLVQSGNHNYGGSQVIFSSFGPGNSFQCCIGYTVSGVKSPVGEDIFTANQFSSNGNYTLTQIDLAFGWVTGTNSFTITLNSDSSGVPGAVLETWALNNAQTFGAQTGPETLLSVGNVKLTAGLYWVVAEPLNPPDDMWGAWNFDSTGQTGNVAQMTNGGGWNVFPGSTLSAFDVLGTKEVTPEPATLVLLGSGLLGIATRLRRRA